MKRKKQKRRQEKKQKRTSQLLNGTLRSYLILFSTGKLSAIIQINQDQLLFTSNENTTNDEKKKSLNVLITDETFYC